MRGESLCDTIGSPTILSLLKRLKVFLGREDSMAKLHHGKLVIIPRKLKMFIADNISLKNDTKADFVYEVKENCDGTHPSICIRIRRVLRRKK
jgi:hypothetical protein